MIEASKILQCEDVNVSLGRSEILKNVSFFVQKGEIAIIIGPNGSGKSTLIKSILGLLPVTSGRIFLFGQDITELSSGQKRRIGYVPQKFSFDRSFPMNVTEFIRLMFFGMKIHSKEVDRKILSVLSDLNVAHLASSQIGDLSGGEMQRVLIARALVHSPEILFLDEPASGIDVGGEETLYEIILDLKQKKALTVVMVSHDLNVVSKYADNVICVNKQMICFGKPEEALNPDSLAKLYSSGVKISEHHHASHNRGEHHHD